VLVGVAHGGCDVLAADLGGVVTGLPGDATGLAEQHALVLHDLVGRGAELLQFFPALARQFHQRPPVVVADSTPIIARPALGTQAGCCAKPECEMGL
jgi:hypothetical protein